jgi:hypothetical protein
MESDALARSESGEAPSGSTFLAAAARVSR